MRTLLCVFGLALIGAALCLRPGVAQDKAKDKNPPVYPVAILGFEERGTSVKDYSSKVGDLLFVRLAVKPEVTLVDRNDIKKVLEEQELNLSGAVKAGEATKIGQLTGAKILVTGSVVQVDKKVFLIAKIIGTETSRVLAASTDGKLSDDLAPLVEQLGDKIAEVIEKQSDKLVAKPQTHQDRVAALKEKLKVGPRPTIMIKIPERHIGMAVPDPAAQTEIALMAKETGFTVLDPEEASKGMADILITGEGISEFALRRGNLVSVKARVEIKATERKTGKVLVADRQNAMVVDLTEQIAGKSALQEAAAILAERVLPKLQAP